MKVFKMNRKIRFRVWDKEASFFWGEGEGMTFKKIAFNFYDDLFKEPEKFIFQQFTGVKDVSGKDIYEGDIVLICNPDGNLYEESPFRVYYSERFACFSFGGGNSLSFYIQRYCYFKIVGNIFENKELLND